MQNWFECKVKYQKIDEYGKEKPHSESYVIDALSFTEAESRLNKMVEGEIPPEFVVAGITKAKLTEIYPQEDADYWYKSKVIFKDVDENSGKEKSIQNQILVAGDNFQDALAHLEKNLEPVLVPWEIHQLSLTKIVDVLPYSIDEEDSEKEELSLEDKNYVSEPQSSDEVSD